MNDDIFDQIHQLLPAESSLSRADGPTPQPQRSHPVAAAPPTPVSAPHTPPVNAMANLALHQNPNPTPAPPAYHQTGPPSLPVRGGGGAPPPPPPPSKPVLAHARALYRYQAADDRDLSFERDDRVAVHEYMNEDWWMGRNERTGAEGIFPKNYVHIDQDYKLHQQQSPAPPQQQQQYAGYGSPAPVGAAGGYPPPPGAGGQNPYNSHVPPMAVAHDNGGQQQQQQQQEGGGGSSKLNEGGKKIGKKLGNAAIFGAGATMGSNLVNSIF